MPFVRMIADAAGMYPQKRNRDMSVGYSGESTLRTEQCDVIEVICLLLGNRLVNKQAIARQSPTHHTVTQELLEAALSLVAELALYHCYP
jgi:hypothetical protein